MEKQNPYLKKMLPNLVIDQNAISLRDLSVHLGKSYSTASILASEKIKNGEWEKVFKQNGKRLISAYRPKKS